MLESKIIMPSYTTVFTAKQGSFFFRHSYKYESSDGIKLRSKDECFWHFFLSALGIAHTYEPDLPETNFRPDFGVANNFLIEICGPNGRFYFGKKSEDYLIQMQDKRETYVNAGYNIIEIYNNYQFINGEPLTDSIIDLIQEHNSGYQKDSKIITFSPEIEIQPTLFMSYKDRKYLKELNETELS